MKNNVVRRIFISLLLSLAFKFGINMAARTELNQFALKILNCICCIIIIIPIFPLLKALFTDSKFKDGKWIILKIVISLWILFLIIGNIYLLLNKNISV